MFFGAKLFKIDNKVKTFKEWQAMGYDKHSVVINPNFIDFISLIPASRLDFGTNLDTQWLSGLSINAVWGEREVLSKMGNGRSAHVYNEIRRR